MRRVGDTVLVILRHNVDPNQPVLEAVITLGFGGVTEVEITSPHPVWRGCRLRTDHFKLVN